MLLWQLSTTITKNKLMLKPKLLKIAKAHDKITKILTKFKIKNENI